MESAKPIEAGCMAMVIPDGEWPELDFEIVHVLSLATEIEINAFGATPNHWTVEHDQHGYYGITENLLMRIDDPDLQKQIESEKELENA